MTQLIKEGLEVAQERMKVLADKGRCDMQFDVGDWVYLKLQPYRQPSVEFERNLKLATRYYGPYQIIAKVGKVAYKLLLPAGSKVHPMFHVSQLKKKMSNREVLTQQLPYTDDNGQL